VQVVHAQEQRTEVPAVEDGKEKKKRRKGQVGSDADGKPDGVQVLADKEDQSGKKKKRKREGNEAVNVGADTAEQDAVLQAPEAADESTDEPKKKKKKKRSSEKVEGDGAVKSEGLQSSGAAAGAGGITAPSLEETEGNEAAADGNGEASLPTSTPPHGALAPSFESGIFTMFVLRIRTVTPLSLHVQATETVMSGARFGG
jgi:hypothetical protein